MNGLATLLLTTLAVLPMEGGPVEERVDLLHVNFYYGENGELVLVQVCFEDWDASEGEYRVVAWRMLDSADKVPQFDWSRKTYYTAWWDAGVHRYVLAPAMKTTYTQYDPEVADREKLPKEERRELRPAPKRKPFVREFPATQ